MIQKHVQNMINTSKIIQRYSNRFRKDSRKVQKRIKPDSKISRNGSNTAPKNKIISNQIPTDSEKMQTPFTKDSKLIEQDSNYNQRRFLFGDAVGRQALSNGAALPSPNLLDTRCPHPNRPKRF